MKKIRLDAEALRVDTFSVETVEQKLRGTVQAEEASRFTISCVGDCSSVPHACFCTEALSCRCN
jgi:hypothetical protein